MKVVFLLLMETFGAFKELSLIFIYEYHVLQINRCNVLCPSVYLFTTFVVDGAQQQHRQ